jgi:hypothetical protein
MQENKEAEECSASLFSCIMGVFSPPAIRKGLVRKPASSEICPSLQTLLY